MSKSWQFSTLSVYTLRERRWKASWIITMYRVPFLVSSLTVSFTISLMSRDAWKVILHPEQCTSKQKSLKVWDCFKIGFLLPRKKHTSCNCLFVEVFLHSLKGLVVRETDRNAAVEKLNRDEISKPILFFPSLSVSYQNVINMTDPCSCSENRKHSRRNRAAVGLMQEPITFP